MTTLKGEIFKGAALDGVVFEEVALSGAVFTGVTLNGQVGVVASFAGAYDAISNLVHVYEIARRTLGAYTGSLVRLRRASDDAESDFGYVANGDLDTAAIATWLGGSAGYVVTVYDQAANGDDITQSTASLQPLYVASGQNGKPVIRFDGTDDYLQGAWTTGGALTQPFMVFATMEMDASIVNTDVEVYHYDGDDSTNRAALLQRASTTPDKWNVYAGSFYTPDSPTDSDPHILSVLISGASTQLWIDGSGQGAGNAGTKVMDGLTWGNRYTAAGYYKGDGLSIIITDANDSQRTATETAINDYWSTF